MSVVLMLAGPNGSGKSTVTKEVPVIGMYVNADDIQKHFHCTTLEAAQNAEQLREYCLANGLDFTMETVLSTIRNIELLRRAKELGYRTVCIFVTTCHPDINVQRVADRVVRGGHDVPEEKIRSRYERSMQNLALLPTLCDELYVVDNSSPRETNEAAVIVTSVRGDITFFPSSNWELAALEALMNGRYFQKYIEK